MVALGPITVLALVACASHAMLAPAHPDPEQGAVVAAAGGRHPDLLMPRPSLFGLVCGVPALFATLARRLTVAVLLLRPKLFRVGDGGGAAALSPDSANGSPSHSFRSAADQSFRSGSLEAPTRASTRLTGAVLALMPGRSSPAPTQTPASASISSRTPGDVLAPAHVPLYHVKQAFGYVVFAVAVLGMFGIPAVVPALLIQGVVDRVTVVVLAATWPLLPAIVIWMVGAARVYFQTPMTILTKTLILSVPLMFLTVPPSVLIAFAERRATLAATIPCLVAWALLAAYLVTFLICPQWRHEQAVVRFLTRTLFA